ncbi:MAG: type IV fimbrial biogenesis protein FimT [Paraglaciecola sp.]|jgi:type IV fimbrial biogenesis protein FimT
MGKSAMRKQNRPVQFGFTLVELMVTVTIVGIIAAIAAPSFVDMIRGNTARSQANQLLATMHYARSEAIKRQATVEVTISGVKGWKAEVKTGTTLLKVIDNTNTGTTVSAVKLGFDLRGRRSLGSPNCINITYGDYKRQLQAGIGGTLKVVTGSCQVVAV